MNRVSVYKILIISFTDLSKDPRIKRQIRFLKDKYALSTIGLKSVGVYNLAFYPIERESISFLSKVKKVLLCKFKLYEKAYWKDYKFNTLLNKLRGKKFDLIISNDIECLPLALKVANGAKVLLDAHEYTPREFEDKFLWRFFLQDYKEYLCKKYIKGCNSMVTVSDGIANEYYKNFNIKPDVITNACDYVDIKPQTTNGQNIKLIHHGVAIPSRKLEVMIEVMNHLDDRFRLDFMLVNNDPGYLKVLKTLAKNKNNIRFIGPVPIGEIVDFINQYDIGIYILPPTNLNYKYILPNKLFEFIQARLAVAIGPSPEMANIVKQYDLGIVAEDFRPETIAKELNKLTKDKIGYYKRQSDKSSYELSSEKNSQKIADMVAEILEQNHS